MKLPLARNKNIVVQEMDNETLVYDLSTNKAYCLNETSAKVFQACGNSETFEDLKTKFKFTDDLIYLSLDELKKNNLIQDEYDSPFVSMNRREVIRKIGTASMVALPIISSLTVPNAANAASGNVGCVTLNQCRPAGTVYCPPGCNQTNTITIYESANGSCTGQPTTYSIDCSNLQGQPSPVDFRRIS